MTVSIPPPYSIQTSRIPAEGSARSCPRPGISAYASITTGSPSRDQMVRKPPELGAMIPGSVHIATSEAAIAASTAFPPSSATAAPASDASWEGDAMLTLRIALNLVGWATS
jgi:hypothetical protein